MDDHFFALLLHARQLRRQGGPRTGSQADDGRAGNVALAIRFALEQLLRAFQCVRDHRRDPRQPATHQMDSRDLGVDLVSDPAPDRDEHGIRRDPRQPSGTRRRGRSRQSHRLARDAEVVPGPQTKPTYRRDQHGSLARRRHPLTVDHQHHRRVRMEMGISDDVRNRGRLGRIVARVRSGGDPRRQQ